MKLSKRLNTIYNWIKSKNYKIIYDVGADHGLLPIYLAQNNPQLQIWATDISSQAITKLKQKTQTLPNIHCVVTSGLQTIQQKTDLVVIAGLGTKTIYQILQDDNPLIKNYIIQSQNNPNKIRKWIQKNNFFLNNEKIIEENNHYYHLLYINKEEGKKIINQTEVIFGPCLLVAKNLHFINFWKQEKRKKEFIKNQINNPELTKQLKKEIKLIENILKL